jgi:hypothetical protein
MEHPSPSSGLDLDAFLHVIQCDHCTEQWGDARIMAYGQGLLQIAVINSAQGSN